MCFRWSKVAPVGPRQQTSPSPRVHEKKLQSHLGRVSGGSSCRSSRTSLDNFARADRVS
jgi:hypothetical protein